MARTPITVTALTVAGTATDPAGTLTGTGAGNGVSVTGAVTEDTILRIVGTNAATVSIKAGSGVAALSAGQGDLTVAVSNGATVWVGPQESARFKQSDGTYAVDASAAVTVSAFKVSRR